jgi:hypothetical protein
VPPAIHETPPRQAERGSHRNSLFRFRWAAKDLESGVSSFIGTPNPSCCGLAAEEKPALIGDPKLRPQSFTAEMGC